MMVASFGTALTYPIVFEQGTQFSLTMSWTNPDGSPIDLTGYTGQFLVVTDLINKTQVLEIATSGGASNTSMVLGGTEGTVTITASTDATAAMTFNSGYHSLFLKSSGDIVYKILEGPVTVNLGINW